MKWGSHHGEQSDSVSTLKHTVISSSISLQSKDSREGKQELGLLHTLTFMAALDIAPRGRRSHVSIAGKCVNRTESEDTTLRSLKRKESEHMEQP